MTPKDPTKLESIHALLEERVLSGHWPVGAQIPTEVELAAEFGCNRATISKAIAQLVLAGLVERRTKAGTRVVRNTPVGRRAEIELDAFAFIYPSDEHDSVWRMLKGFQAAGRQASRRIVMLPSGTDYQKEMELVGRLSEFDVKGAVVFPLLPTPADVVQFSNQLHASKLPIVLTEVSLPGLGCPTIVADAFHASYTMTRHLIAQGLKRIGFLANYARMPAVCEEYRGYLWALEEARLAPPQDGVLLDPSVNPDFNNPLDEPLVLGRRLLERALASLEGVVCTNDFLAVGAMQAAQERGLAPGAALRVVSCNDYGLTGPNGLTLTTYRLPWEEMGRRSFAMLDQLVSGAPFLHIEEVVRGSLVVGRSG